MNYSYNLILSFAYSDLSLSQPVGKYFMFSKLFVLFVLVPAVELYLLILIGQQIGALETFGIILATGLLGSFLAKTQGLATWIKLQKKLATGQIPGKELLDGAIILISAAFLLTPGVLTDIVGLLGLFPVTRSIFRKALMPWLIKIFNRQAMSGAVRFQATSFDPENTTSHSAPQYHGDSIVDGQATARPEHLD